MAPSAVFSWENCITWNNGGISQAGAACCQYRAPVTITIIPTCVGTKEQRYVPEAHRAYLSGRVVAHVVPVADDVEQADVEAALDDLDALAAEIGAGYPLGGNGQGTIDAASDLRREL